MGIYSHDAGRLAEAAIIFAKAMDKIATNMADDLAFRREQFEAFKPKDDE